MQQQMKGAAWALGLWGALSVIFGVLIVAWPGISLKTFLVILGVYFLVGGVVMAIGSLLHREGHWVAGSLMGGLSALAGLYTFAHPSITALAVLAVIAIWAIATGMLQIVAGFEAKPNNWWLVFAGAVYTLFGFYIFANPKGGALTTIWLIGLSVIVSGIALVVAAFKVDDLGKKLGKA